MTDTTRLVDDYLAVWNETDPRARRAALAAVYAEDGSYTDPLADAHGRDEVDATVAAVQGQFPGLTFRRRGDVDAHHDLARFTWVAGTGGQDLVVGFDVAVLRDGRIAAVHGFLDQVPAGLLAEGA